MTKSLAGKTIAITGGSSGIGLGIVKALLSYKAHVAVADVQEVPAELASYLDKQLTFTKVDVRSRAEVHNWIKQTVQKFGRLDGISANAGICIWEGGSGATADDLFQHVFDVNVKGVWNTVTEAFFQFEEQKSGGSIVTTASGAGLRSYPGNPAYSGSKHAVIGLTKTWAATWASKGIRVNSIAPGTLDLSLEHSPSFVVTN